MACGPETAPEEPIPEEAQAILQLEGPEMVTGGQVFTYVAKVTVSSGAVEMATLELRLPAQASSAAVQVTSLDGWDCEIEERVVRCSRRRLPPGRSEVRLGGFFQPTLARDEVVEATAQLGARNLESQTARLAATPSGTTTLAVSEEVTSAAAAGSVITYRLALRNTGAAAALSPQIEVSFPDEVYAYLEPEVPAGWSCGFVPVGPVAYSCQADRLELGREAAVEIQARLDPGLASGARLVHRFRGLAANAPAAEASAVTTVESR